MAFILDNIVAVLIASVVILAIIALQLDTQTSNTQVIGAEVTRGALVDFVEVIEHDLRNVASPDTSSALVAWSDAVPSTGAPVTVLDFWAVIDTAVTAIPQRIQYEVAFADSVEVSAGNTKTQVPVFTLRRLVAGGSSFDEAGRSPHGLTEFVVTPLDRLGNPTASASTARALAFRTAFVPRWGGENVVSDARFETVFRPPGLSF